MERTAAVMPTDAASAAMAEATNSFPEPRRPHTTTTHRGSGSCWGDSGVWEGASPAAEPQATAAAAAAAAACAGVNGGGGGAVGGGAVL